MSDALAKSLVETGKKLFSKKGQWNELCQEIAEHFYPLRSDFTTSFSLGTDFSVDLMESTGVLARETLGNAPEAMLRQGNWFKVSTGVEEIDDKPENEKWLEAATKRYRSMIYDRRANFSTATKEADHDWVTFGNPVLSVQTDAERKHLLFKAYHPKDCAWTEDASGHVDRMHRKVPMTARNVVSRYPKTVHSIVKDVAKKDPTKIVQIEQVVLPVGDLNLSKDEVRKKFGDNEFASIFVDTENDTVLSESGLPVFNFVVPRWRRAGKFPQGFSPITTTALPDSRTLQVVTQTLLETGEKSADAPLIGNANIFRDSLNVYAGGFTTVDLKEGSKIRDNLMQLPPGGDFNVGLSMQNDFREMISEAFLLNKLFLPDTRAMTAFEVEQRLAEFRRAALPFFGPIESEYHLPLLEIGFAIAITLDEFKENIADMPDDLAERDAVFNFTSPLDSADGSEKVSAYQQTLQLTAATAQVDPKAANRIDFAKAYTDAVKGAGASASWFKDETQTEAEDASQDQISSIEAAAQLANAGADLTKNVSEAEMAATEAGLQ